MTDLLGLFDDLERNSIQEDEETDGVIIRAPFGWPGGKSRSVKFIIPHLPYYKTYCEPFGGSGAVLLGRKVSTLEVYNDRYGGVVAFYRCLRDPKLFDRLVDWLDLTVNAREEWTACVNSWEDVDDPVERAGRWYYMNEYSFGSLGRCWGRARGGNYKGINGKIRNKLQHFPNIHKRFRDVQIENLDAIVCMKQYDTPQTVFYIDPPYVDADPGMYKCKITRDYHSNLIAQIFECEGFVAVSGYSNPLYDNRDWDAVFEWDVSCTIQGVRGTEKNKLAALDGVLQRGSVTERLWIKEAK